MKFIIIILLAFVLLIPASVFGEFTGSANESIAFESKYDWEKDYQYGSMGIFIEGDVILNAPYSGQQIVINIQKPNGAMNLYDIIQLDPSAHYGFFLRDTSGYWPLGETKIELRNNLAHYTGVINIVDNISNEISEPKENILEQKIPTAFSAVECIYDSKRLWSIVQTCNGIESEIRDTCDFRCGSSEINYSLKDHNGDVLSTGSFENVLKIPLKEYPEDTIITFSRTNLEDKELKLCSLNIVKHGDTAPKFESYAYEKPKIQTQEIPNNKEGYATLIITSNTYWNAVILDGNQSTNSFDGYGNASYDIPCGKINIISLSLQKQASTAKHSQAQPSTVKHSQAQPSTAKHSTA